ncbi:MAG: radical SAM protein [Oscillospiraceae bacterium]|nr:radical SAM protein [Oscillospiraceae bacterium]
MGAIFSVEEFSTFDGPGIRMTVFMKGCPLRCMWCHNPEGQSFHSQYVRSQNGCLHCGACLAAGGGILTADSISVCPQNLIRLCGTEISPEAMIQEIEGKLWMLNASGGGVTFSGGEPLAQPDFLMSCLDMLEGKTHRAIQTSGFASKEIFAEALKRCEYVLYDLKLMDSELHKKYTGVDNRCILENYRTLATSGKPFITRIPLIPCVNDTLDNITQTAQFMSQLGVTKVELLPYNKAAGAKYKMLGREYITDFDPSVPPQSHTEVFEHYGIGVKIL